MKYDVTNLKFAGLQEYPVVPCPNVIDQIPYNKINDKLS